MLDTPALAEALYAAVDARDLPGMVDVDSSLLLFCGEIRKEVTVALSGECADELFGGYPWYRDADVRRVNGFPWAQSTAYRAKFLRPELAEKIEKLNADLVAQQQSAVDAEKWVNLIKQYVNPSELTAELLNALIEKIVVHEAVKDESNTRTQEIEIYYRFIGKVE